MSWANLGRFLVGIGSLMVLLSLIGHVPLIQTSKPMKAKARWLVCLGGIALVFLGVGMFGHHHGWWSELRSALPAK